MLEKKNEKNIIILYGYTGVKGDTNGIVGEVIDEKQLDSVANIVDFHSVYAIKNWNCDHLSKLCSKFIMVFNNCTVEFGKDTKISDSLTDILVCFDGGLQSLLQIFNCLIDGKTVILYYNLRNNNDEFTSASKIIMFIKDLVKDYKVGFKRLREEDYYREKISEYLSNCNIIDKKKQDYGTKLELMEEAMEKFYGKSVWELIETQCIIVGENDDGISESNLFI